MYSVIIYLYLHVDTVLFTLRQLNQEAMVY